MRNETPELAICARASDKVLRSVVPEFYSVAEARRYLRLAIGPEKGEPRVAGD
jgi:hypothetical protein